MPPLSNISALNMLDTVLRSASHIFQPAVIINSQDGGFTNRAGHIYTNIPNKLPRSTTKPRSGNIQCRI